MTIIISSISISIICCIVIIIIISSSSSIIIPTAAYLSRLHVPGATAARKALRTCVSTLEDKRACKSLLIITSMLKYESAIVYKLSVY